MTYEEELSAVGVKADAQINGLIAEVEQNEADLAALDLQLAQEVDKVVDLMDEVAELEAEVARLNALLNPPPPPPPTPTYVMPWGYSADKRAQLEKDTGATVKVERCYDQPGMHASGALGVPNKMSDTHIMQTPAGYLPVYSFKTDNWISAANPTGPEAKDFEAFIRSIDRDVVVVADHEPENNGRGTQSGKTQAQAFVGMVTNYGLIVKRVGNPKVKFGINLMSYWIDTIGSGGTEYSEAYIPKNANVDFPLIVSWDGYQKKATTTVGAVFDKAAALSAKYGSPFAIGETGSGVDAGLWVTQVSDYAAAKKAAFACYWPSQVAEVGATQYYPLPKDFPKFKAVALKYGGKAL